MNGKAMTTEESIPTAPVGEAPGEGKSSKAKTHFFWGMLSHAFLDYSMGKIDERRVKRYLDGAERKGADITALRDWRPTFQQRINLKLMISVVDAVSIFKNSERSPIDEFLVLGAVDESPAWQCLYNLACRLLTFRGVNLAVATPLAPPPPSADAAGKRHLQPDGAADHGRNVQAAVAVMGGKESTAAEEERLAARRRERREARRLRAEQIKQKREAKIKSAKEVIKQLQEDKRPSVSVSDFARKSDQIRIYIDETWPETFQKGRETGVIAGIVWRGGDVDYQRLAKIKNHLRFTSSGLTALRQLLACPDVFPFLMPVKATGKLATEHYFELIEAAIKILLGWLLPQSGRVCNVRIFIEQIGGYSCGTVKTDYFQGVMETLRHLGARRFARWRLEEVSWRDKEFEYIAYADLIAYLHHEHTDINRETGAVVAFRQWPGFVPLSLDLVDRLMRLDQLEANDDVEAVLDFAADIQGTELSRVIMADLKRRLENREDLQFKLLESLEERYRIKEESGKVLSRLARMAGRLVTIPEDKSRLRLRLMRLILSIQRANLDGNPEAGKTAVRYYRLIRGEAAALDRNLSAHADLVSIVHLHDQFRFEEALNMNRALIDDGFSYYPPVLGGCILSSMGQCLSFLGRHGEAESFYEQALAKFLPALAQEPGLDRELDQTRIYRALNSLDADLTGAAYRIEEVVEDVGRSLSELAMDNDPEGVYDHHLILRYLWFKDGSSPAVKEYLARKNDWLWGRQHPWELIACYRGLLLWRHGGRTGLSDAAQWFIRGMDVADEENHGATLWIIGAMIGVVALCCLGGDLFQKPAERLLMKAKEDLPQAAVNVAALRKILLAPHPDRINEALTALPFHFH